MRHKESAKADQNSKREIGINIMKKAIAAIYAFVRFLET
jgi:hypothetical protein